MEMVGHQYVGIEIKRISAPNGTESLQESFVVVTLEKYFLAVIAPRHDMVEKSRSVNPWITWHERKFAEILTLSKSDTKGITGLCFMENPKRAQSWKRRKSCFSSCMSLGFERRQGFS